MRRFRARTDDKNFNVAYPVSGQQGARPPADHRDGVKLGPSTTVLGPTRCAGSAPSGAGPSKPFEQFRKEKVGLPVALSFALVTN